MSFAGRSSMVEEPWYAPRSPEEIISQPWLHAAVIEHLEGLLRPDWKVLEHGAGGSTLWFAARVARVVSVEHSQAWRSKVRELAPANVSILEFLPYPDRIYDLFFIDGERAARGACLRMAPDFVKPGGWIVLDNANRPEWHDEREGLAEVTKLQNRFDNNIPNSRFFVTGFW